MPTQLGLHHVQNIKLSLKLLPYTNFYYLQLHLKAFKCHRLCRSAFKCHIMHDYVSVSASNQVQYAFLISCSAIRVL